jgi:hypothetical protein
MAESQPSDGLSYCEAIVFWLRGVHGRAAHDLAHFARLLGKRAHLGLHVSRCNRMTSLRSLASSSAVALNFSKALRVRSKLATAIDRISLWNLEPIAFRNRS